MQALSAAVGDAVLLSSLVRDALGQPLTTLGAEHWWVGDVLVRNLERTVALTVE